MAEQKRSHGYNVFSGGSPGLVRPFGSKGPWDGPLAQTETDDGKKFMCTLRGPEHMLRAPVSGGGYSLSR